MLCYLCQASDFGSWCPGFVRCLHCGLVIRQDLNAADYKNAYWIQNTDPDGIRRDMSSRRERDFKIRNWFRDEIGFCNRSEGCILDIGCGFGFFLSALKPSWKKHGLELSDICVQHIRQNYPDIEVRQLDLMDAGYESDSFDVVMMSHIIEHVTHPVELMREVFRVIRPGGWLLLSTPNIESFVARRFRGNFRLLHDKTHICMYGPGTLNLLLQKTGFIAWKIKHPFFRTDYFTLKNLWRLIDKNRISPPFYGNILTVYAQKKVIS